MDGPFVEFRGVRVIAGWPERVLDAQDRTHIVLRGTASARVRYGSERVPWGGEGRPCVDCVVIPGELHVPGCPIEQCPVCEWQLITCPCGFDGEGSCSWDGFLARFRDAPTSGRQPANR